MDGCESHAATSGAILQWIAVIFPLILTKGLQGKPMNTSQQYAKEMEEWGTGVYMCVCVCVWFFICHRIFINLNFFSVFFFSLSFGFCTPPPHLSLYSSFSFILKTVNPFLLLWPPPPSTVSSNGRRIQFNSHSFQGLDEKKI